MKSLQFFLFSFFLTFFLSTISAQNITEGTANFSRKISGNALSITVQGQPKNVTTVLDQKFLAGTGSKGKNKGGMRTYEGARFRTLSTSTLDMYYKVEKASRSDANNSRVHLFLSAGNYNFLNSNKYPDEMRGAREILEGLQLDVTIYELELAMDEQGKVIDKEIRNHERMVKDSVDLEVKLAETQTAIEENKVDRANQLIKIDEERNRLMDFKKELHRLKTGEALPEDSDEAEFEDGKEEWIKDNN